MSAVPRSSDGAVGTPPVKAGEVDLEVVVIAVSDVDRADLAARGVEVSEVFHEGARGARFHVAGRVAGLSPERASYGSFASFSDPDGNGWLFQEVTTRLPGR